MGTVNKRSVLWVTYLNIVLYALCYQLQRPVEPFLVETLSKESDSASVALNYGKLQSFFSAIQTIGSPLVGMLLDRIGIRMTSAVVFLASAASYGMLAIATEMKMLFFSKVPTAFQHAFLVAQAAAAASTTGDEASRAQALGLMTTSYTIGATIGPAAGGFLAQEGDLYTGARFAVVGSLLSVLLSIVFLPGRSATPSQTTQKTKSKADGLRGLFRMATRKTIWPLLVVKVFGGVSASMYSLAFPIVLTQHLNYDPSTLGLVMSSSSIAVAVFGAFGLSPLTSKLGAANMSNIGLVLRVMLGGIMALVLSGFPDAAYQRISIVSISVLNGLASHMLATGLTTRTTGVVPVEEQGALLGLEHGLFSMARICGPPIGAWLLATYSTFLAVATPCAAIDLSLVVLMVITGGAPEYKDKTG